ncbi:surfactin synthase thioesterase subunit [Streptomyces umbrinus]|uniref:Surfactin synthase thioesterase subunit n=1 Tax=Streptomyces umbrinus TaxID=67370 RepID=A0ABU0SNL3_9ACTN|nr:thioesterase domain-containing protein [Streptomyces umbrinus]MDQ1025077.1 surfactin synthase thioesterase subunit [Streptomyces umbrinus]
MDGNGAPALPDVGLVRDRTEARASVIDTDVWTRRYFPRVEARVRLVRLPHAGGSASFYRPGAQALRPRVEVLAVRYPGRQDRRHEPLIDDLRNLEDKSPRRLEAREICPLRLFGSARRAPSADRDERVHLRDDEELMRMMLPVIRGDHRAAET